MKLSRSIALLALFCPLAAPGRGHAQPAPDRATVVTDSIVTAALARGQAAGLTVAVVRGRDTLVLKGYGSADLELGVPTPTNAVYEIGSVTKQFTAAAILQLQEAGKLSLDDDVTKFLPSYATQGHRVTIQRLLDHTSGIRGYTELPEFGALMQRHLPPDSLVALFGPKPFDFAPGEAMSYNNSAYFLLGLVIEKASGQSYAAYMKEHLFARAGMPDSRYCSNIDVVPRRAHGYDAGPDGLRLAQYIDFAWPYSAGSLCSTAGDLVAWTRALHGGRILGPAAYRELLTPGTLDDGTRLRYSKGLFVNDSVYGHAQIHHGGDIPGFATALTYLPDDSMIVAVLMNTEGPVRPDAIANEIVRALLGDRTPKRPTFAGRASDYAGEYRGTGRGRPLVLRFAPDSTGGLTLATPNASPRPLAFLGGDTFGLGSARFTFVRERGAVTKVRADMLATNSLASRQPAARAAADPKP
jgi:CubicO group peptidase (beta-lactamase class C family)